MLPSTTGSYHVFSLLKHPVWVGGWDVCHFDSICRGCSYRMMAAMQDVRIFGGASHEESIYI